ncbi:MAG: TerD family protein, partial [Patulibacter sp.]|nr:TerD family protein [Patulibacter sp.]
MSTLVSGANTAIPEQATAVTARLTVERGSADLFALLLDQAERAEDDAVVFYNRTTSPDGSVVLDAAARRLDIALSDVPAGIERILIVAQADGEGDLSTVGTLTLSVAADGHPAATVEFTPPPFPTVRVAEVYRRADAWKVRALCDGYAAGLVRLLEVHGIEVDADDEPETMAPSPSPASGASAAAPAPAVQAPAP